MKTLSEALLEAGAWCTSAPPGEPTPVDYLLVGLAFVVLVFAFAKAVGHTLRPGEVDRAHVKWRVLDDEEVQ